MDLYSSCCVLLPCKCIAVMQWLWCKLCAVLYAVFAVCMHNFGWSHSHTLCASVRGRTSFASKVLTAEKVSD